MKNSSFAQPAQLLGSTLMVKKRSKFKALPLFLASALLLLSFLGNILLGMLAQQQGMALFYLGPVWEFLMLFGAAAGFVLFALLNESPSS